MFASLPRKAVMPWWAAVNAVVKKSEPHRDAAGLQRNGVMLFHATSSAMA